MSAGDVFLQSLKESEQKLKREKLEEAYAILGRNYYNLLKWNKNVEHHAELEGFYKNIQSLLNE